MSKPGKRQAPVLEAMESRLLLSVTAEIVAGDLIITGDAGDNVITITKSGDTYSITGDLEQTVDCTGNVQVDLQAGSDSLVLTNVVIGTKAAPRDLMVFAGSGTNFVTGDSLDCLNLIIFGGDGDNYATIQKGLGAKGSLIRGYVQYNGGSAGNDNICILGSKVVGAANIDGGRGTNYVKVDSENGIKSEIKGGLVYTGGLNNDTIEIYPKSLINGLVMNAGAGTNVLTITDAVIGASASRLADVTYYGDAEVDTLYGAGFQCRNVLFWGGGGANQLLLHPQGTKATKVGGTLSFIGDIEADTVNLYGTQVKGECTLTMGDGAGGATFDTEAGVKTKLSAGLTVVSGTGDDYVYVNDTSIAGAVVVSTGPGTNSVSLTNVALGARKDLTLDLNAGDDQTSLSHVTARNVTIYDTGGTNYTYLQKSSGSAQTRLTGDFVYVGGAGADEVDLMGARIQGAMNLSLGEGDNRVFVNDETGVRTRIGKDVTLTGGEGNDLMIWSGGTTVGGSVYATLNGGDDQLNLTDTTIGSGRKDVNVDMGAGNDRLDGYHLVCRNIVAQGYGGDNHVLLTRNDNGSSDIKGSVGFIGDDGGNSLQIIGSTVRKDVNTAFGNGTNYLEIRQHDATQIAARVLGRVTYLGGAGADYVRVTSSKLYKAAAVEAGDGDNGLTVISAELRGDLVYQGGTGVDTAILVGSAEAPWTTGGTLTLVTGAGDDLIQMTARGTVKKDFQVNAGDGADSLTLSTNVRVKGSAVVYMGTGADTAQVAAEFSRLVTLDGGVDLDIDTVNYSSADFGARTPVVTNFP